MEGTLNKFSITATKKRPLSPFQDTGATESIQKRCRRTEAKHYGFGDDMVFEILTWLPAKSLMRFRCVSKAWNNLIRHDVNFVKSHKTHSQARPLAKRLLFDMITGDGNVVERTTCNFPTQLEGLSLQLVRPHHFFDSRDRIICSNHCNGLICFYSHKDTQTYLYNVTTGEIKVLPEIIPKRCPLLLLGFDPNTEKYKLLHSVHLSYDQYEIKILTLGTNSWRIMDDKSGKYPRSYSAERCVFLNGILYWIYNNPSPDNTVHYFNFIEEKFGTLLLPQITSMNKVDRMRSALWGKLVIDCHQRCGINDIYEKLNWVYDEVNKVFMKFNSDNPELEKKKVVLLEATPIDDSCGLNFVLATTSLISASACLEFPRNFWFGNVSSFVENIIPLTFIL